MKLRKILAGFLAGAVAMSSMMFTVNADVYYNGSDVVNLDTPTTIATDLGAVAWDGTGAGIDSGTLSALDISVTDDCLLVNYTATNENGGQFYCTDKEDWSASTLPYKNTGTAVFTITDAMLTKGIMFNGADITINSVSYAPIIEVYEAGTSFNVSAAVAWDGTGAGIDASDLVADDIIADETYILVSYTATNDNGGQFYCTDKNNWSASTLPYKGNGSALFAVTSAMITNGIMFNGADITINTVTAYNPPAPTSYGITSTQTNGGSFAVTLNNDPYSTEVINEAEAGDDVYIFFNPNIGYEVTAYMIMGRSTGEYYVNENSNESEDVSDVESITFDMPEEPIAIVAYFGMASYDVTVLPSENGTVFANNPVASYGDEIKITATPSSGYEVSSIVVKNDTGETIATTDTFLMPDSDVTVEVIFKEAAEEDNTEADEEDDIIATVIDLGAPTSGWDATFDDATDTVNISNAWGGMTWSINSDCSNYSKIVLKYSDSTLDSVLFSVTYGDNTQDFQTSKAANGEITVELDDAKKSDVLHVNLGGSSIPGSIKIISIELIPEPMFNKTATEFEAADAGKIVSQTAIIDGKTAKRFTMLVGIDAIKKAEKAVFTLNNGTTTKTHETTMYYASLTASGTTVNAPAGYGFVTLTITDIPDGVNVTCEKVELTVKA